MTTSSSDSPPPDYRDITQLAKTILDGERRPFDERPPPAPRRFRPEALVSLRAPAVVVQLLLAAWIPFGVLTIVFGFMQRSLLHRVVSDPAGVRLAEIIADQDRADATNGIFIVLLIATGAAFLVWFSRAYRNLDAFDLPRRYGTGWAIGGWFVPFLNLARPKQVADDIWASVTVAKYGDPGARGGSFLLAAWWGAWIAAGVSGFFARSNSEDATIDEALTSNGVFVARSALFVVAAILAVFVVRSITRAQTPTGAAGT